MSSRFPDIPSMHTIRKPELRFDVKRRRKRPSSQSITDTERGATAEVPGRPRNRFLLLQVPLPVVVHWIPELLRLGSPSGVKLLLCATVADTNNCLLLLGRLSHRRVKMGEMLRYTIIEDALWSELPQDM
jgi:hypothetical protein